MTQPQPRDYRLPTPQLQVVSSSQTRRDRPNPRLVAANEFSKSLDQLNKTFATDQPTEAPDVDFDELEQEIEQLLRSQ